MSRSTLWRQVVALHIAARDLVAEAIAVDPPDPGLVIRARQLASDVADLASAVAELASDVSIAGEVG